MADRLPNILWICTDQQRYDTIGRLNNPYVSTPTLDSLVDEGVAFERAYCQSPICTPSRASFLTGRYPSTLHACRNGNSHFPIEHPPLVTKLLAQRGYDCANIGKLHLSSAFGRIEQRTDDGYRYWQYSHAPRDDWPRGHDYSDWVRAQGEDLGELIASPDGVPAELHQTTWCIEKTLDFVDQKRAGPWMASVNIYDPHPPFNPPPEYRGLFDPADMPGPLFRPPDLEQQALLAAIDFQSDVRPPHALDINNRFGPEEGRNDGRTLQAAYYAMIKLIDDGLARLLDGLEERDQRRNTLILFTSDHGEMLGDHGLIQKGCRFYEGLVRVPLIWSFPQTIQQGIRSAALVELTDIAPTLLEVAGMAIPDGTAGRSLWPILTGNAPVDQHRESVRCEYFDALAQPDGSRGTMLRNERYKFVLYHGHGEGELYDLQVDPEEFRNLWDDPNHQSVKIEMMQQSFDSLAAAVDTGPPRIGPM